MNFVYQISISKGGVPKFPVQEAIVTFNGIVGDRQKNKRYHGGPERAICLLSLDVIEKLKKEGHPIFPGSTGENLTIVYPQYESLAPGAILKIGREVVLEITSFTAPCKTISESFKEGKFTHISQKVFPGQSRLYAKVLEEGIIKVGDEIVPVL